MSTDDDGADGVYRVNPLSKEVGRLEKKVEALTQELKDTDDQRVSWMNMYNRKEIDHDQEIIKMRRDFEASFEAAQHKTPLRLTGIVLLVLTTCVWFLANTSLTVTAVATERSSAWQVPPDHLKLIVASWVLFTGHLLALIKHRNW